MSDEQLKEIQKQLFFELGYKVDIYHFEHLREIAVVKNGDPLIVQNVVKTFKY